MIVDYKNKVKTWTCLILKKKKLSDSFWTWHALQIIDQQHRPTHSRWYDFIFILSWSAISMYFSPWASNHKNQCLINEANASIAENDNDFLINQTMIKLTCMLSYIFTNTSDVNSWISPDLADLRTHGSPTEGARPY